MKAREKYSRAIRRRLKGEAEDGAAVGVFVFGREEVVVESPDAREVEKRWTAVGAIVVARGGETMARVSVRTRVKG